MARYKVVHDYRSHHNGRTFGYTGGTTVEVDDDVARWVNRDSPGTLEPVEPHECGVCGETFKSARALGGHKSAHSAS